MIQSLKHSDSLSAKAFRRLASDRMIVSCFLIIAMYVVIMLLGFIDLLPDYQERVGGSYERPSFTFAKVLGTDLFGRSVLYKILAGAETAMTIGFLVTSIAIPVGIILGALAGYYGGFIDTVIVWIYSVIVSIPSILLILAISFILDKGLFSICIALGSVGWVSLCRLIRAEFIKHKNREYVLASRLVGANDFALIFRHILPNTVHIAIVTASLLVLTSMMSEVVLTYLGVGIQDGASWGTMIAHSPGEIVNGIWWPLASVTLALFLVAYSLNIVGDALRDALDPKIMK